MTVVTAIGKSRIFVSVVYIVVLAAAVVAGYLSPWGHPVAVAAFADVVGTIVVFAFSVRADNSSVYDPYWSVAPPVIAVYWAVQSPTAGVSIGGWLLLVVVFAWSGRLTANWVRRWRGLIDEDWRYRMFRDRHGRWYWLVSLTGIHLFPTFLVFLACLPLYAALYAGPLVVPGVIAGLAITVAGILIEARADGELHRFTSEVRDPEDVLASGLWGRCRHPNYLGEVLFWWGLAVVGITSNPAYWWTAVGALSVTLLFRFISIPMMDRRMVERRPGYEVMMSSTPALIPSPGGGRGLQA